MMENLVLIVIGCAIGLVVSFFALRVARKRGFFAYPAGDKPTSPVTFGAFVGLFVFSLGGVALLGLLAYLVFGGNGFYSFMVTIQSSIWLLGLLLIPIQVWYVALLGSHLREWIWGKRLDAAVKIGALGLLVAWPVTMTASAVAGLGVRSIVGPYEMIQLPIEQFKLAMQHWSTLIPAIAMIVVIGPVLEEIFFRGFLQGWLRRYLSRPISLVVTALLFALAHLRAEQGWANIQVGVGIFVLGCFLGHLFERQRSLFASITLHMLFNLITCLILLVTPA